MKKVYLLLGVMWLIAAMCSAVTAAEQSFSDSIALTSTNWNSTLNLQKFDPSLGTLESVFFSLTGYVTGTAQFESLDNTPATVEMELKALITVSRPDMTQLIAVLPTVKTSDNVSAFDGIPDFGGTSGKTYPNINHPDFSNSAGDSLLILPPSADLDLFTGVGNLVLPVSAIGQSQGLSAGNIAYQFSTSARADATVRYVYTPNQEVIPEASSLILAMSGLGGIMGFARLRRR